MNKEKSRTLTRTLTSLLDQFELTIDDLGQFREHTLTYREPVGALRRKNGEAYSPVVQQVIAECRELLITFKREFVRKTADPDHQRRRYGNFSGQEKAAFIQMAKTYKKTGYTARQTAKALGIAIQTLYNLGYKQFDSSDPLIIEGIDQTERQSFAENQQVLPTDCVVWVAFGEGIQCTLSTRKQQERHNAALLKKAILLGEEGKEAPEIATILDLSVSELYQLGFSKVAIIQQQVLIDSQMAELLAQATVLSAQGESDKKIGEFLHISPRVLYYYGWKVHEGEVQ